MNPKKSIKKKRFLKNDKIERMKQLIGENCWEEEFDKLDQDRDEKITFEDLIRNLLHNKPDTAASDKVGVRACTDNFLIYST